MALGDFHFSSLRICTYYLYSFSTVTRVGFCFGGSNMKLKDSLEVQFVFSLLFFAYSLVTLCFIVGLLCLLGLFGLVWNVWFAFFLVCLVSVFLVSVCFGL